MPKDEWAKARRKDVARAAGREKARREALSREADRLLAGAGRSPAPWYQVAKGTRCHVRKKGERKWRPHTTREDASFHEHLWRNEGWYGFSRQGWELKVPRRCVKERLSARQRDAVDAAEMAALDAAAFAEHFPRFR